ncbi:MAG: TIGR00282 family metallophosphoesterase [Clostridia bacterium]|nr:TIGR00282 family metallophosphoesterase [Clostridia bacterium]
MKILAIGDIFGRVGRDAVFEYLEHAKGDYDFIIANGENAAHGRGLSKPVYEELVSAGIDAFTLGNHAWGCPDISTIMHYNENIVRPANFEGDVFGVGSTVLTAKNGVKIGIINLIGRIYMPQQASSPFYTADAEIEKIKNKCDMIIVDFHAEATSEKLALGYYLDGRVSVIFGTHTHVQTADAKVLPNGTGYISDLGMTGPAVSVLGVDKSIIVDRFLGGIPKKFAVANGNPQFCGAVFEVDENTKKAVNITRIYEEF